MAKDPAFLFYPNDWCTPNTYDTNFKFPTEKSGVYLLVNTILNSIEKLIVHEILYVGSAVNLKNRYVCHEVLRVLRKDYEYIQFYFIEVNNYKEIEKKLINKIQPKYNTQWR